MLQFIANRILRYRQAIEQYRLSRSEQNILLHKIATRYAPELEGIDNIEGFHFVKSHDKTFVICPMSKDAQSEDNEGYMPFLGNVVKDYFKSHNDRSATLLLPVFLCRGYAKMPIEYGMKRKHAVLIEIDQVNKLIQVHDSQGYIRWALYPDKIYETLEQINEVSGIQFQYNPNQDYHTYSIQVDEVSCGFHVANFVESILANGSSEKCNLTPKINILVYTDKYHFAKEKYGAEMTYEATQDANDRVYTQPLTEEDLALGNLDQDGLIKSFELLSSSPRSLSRSNSSLTDGWCGVDEEPPVSFNPSISFNKRSSYELLPKLNFITSNSRQMQKNLKSEPIDIPVERPKKSC